MDKLHYLFLSFVLVLASACSDGPGEATVSMADGIQTVTAFAETEPVPDDDDAADDPYIMVTDQGKTIVAGTVVSTFKTSVIGVGTSGLSPKTRPI